MKNKKGFTLVELLAVIVILAVLVLIAVPNVIKSLNNAKKNTFSTEAESIIETAKMYYLENSSTACFSLDNLKALMDNKNWTGYAGFVLVDISGSSHKIWLTNGTYAINGSITGNLSVTETSTNINAVKNRTNCN